MKQPPADDAAEAEPRPGRVRKPIGWSMIFILVLVVVSAALVWRRDGIDCVLAILTEDVSLFGGIMPRVLAGCLLGAFIAEILPHEKVSRSLGPRSGLKGLLIGTAFGAIPARRPLHRLSGSCRTAHGRRRFRCHHCDGGELDADRLWPRGAWELPILGTDFTLWRIVISLPLPVLAGALGRFVYARVYSKDESE